MWDVSSWLGTADVNSWLSTAGEWAIAIVIYLEVENNRFDHFFADASDQDRWKARRTIYLEFCGLERASGPTFLDLLREKPDLRDQCDREIAVMIKIGNSLPILPPLRRRVLGWFPHTAVFLWEILHPYIQQRRLAAGPHWGRPFIRFVRASAKYLLRTGGGDLILLDPDVKRAKNYVISRQRLESLVRDLSAEMRVRKAL